MALANLSILFARDYKREVVVLDWDLEAPGLHRFFGIPERKIENGVIDYFNRYKSLLSSQKHSITEDKLDLEPFLIEVRKFENGGRVRLLSAGCLKNHLQYAKHVNEFDWDEFYKDWKGAQFIEYIRERLKQLAQIVMIDSRTGITDIGSICTLHLPDIVVLVFSFNEQNIAGTEAVATDIVGENPILKKIGRQPDILLLPSRKELGQIDRLRDWERKAEKRLGKFVSTQRLQNRYKDILKYIRESAIPYVPYFAYGEDLSAESEKGYEQVEAYTILADLLTGRSTPEIKLSKEKEKVKGLSVNTLISIIMVLFTLSFISEIVWPSYNSPIRILLFSFYVSLQYTVSIFCVSFFKNQFKFAQIQESEIRPMLSYLLAGFFAILLGVILSFLWSLSIQNYEIKYALQNFSLSYPWLLINFTTALTASFHFDNSPRRGLRWIEAFSFSAVLILTGIFIKWWLNGILPVELAHRTPALYPILFLQGIVGFFMGYFFPSWYRWGFIREKKESSESFNTN
jgi:hypothetical protein